MADFAKEIEKRRTFAIISHPDAGKTTLTGLLSEYSARGSASGIALVSDKPCTVFAGPANQWGLLLGALRETIVFIDEGYDFIFTKEFAQHLKGSSNYYVLITRKPLRNLPYSIHEIYGIRTSGKYHFPDQVCHEFYPILSDETMFGLLNREFVLLVEDEKAGYQFFSSVFPGKCLGVGGNSNFYSMIKEHSGENGVCVIADGAAFGAFIYENFELWKRNNNIMLYFPESFEWIILKSGVVRAEGIEDVLAHPEDYIESARFFSWERFFTDYLRNITKDDRIRKYDKGRLADYYLSKNTMREIKAVMPEEMRYLVEEE